MRLRRLFSLLLSLPLSCAIAFSLACIDVSAVSGGRYMTPNETRQIFGDTIPAKYFNGTDYTDIIFNYIGTSTLSSCDWVDSSGYFTTGRDVICYFVNNVRNVNSNANYITVDCTPEYSLFDFDTLYTNIGVSNSQTQNIAAYQSPFWKWFIDDSEITFEGSSAIPATGEFPHCVLANGNRSYIFCPVEYQSQSLVSGYSLRAGFYGASHYNNAMYLYIACPYITDGATGQTGTYTTTSSVNTDININVDLDETNGLLETINNTISGIVSGIAGIFIPSAADLEEWRLDIVDLLNDTFGDIPALHDQLQDAVENIITVTARTSVEFPGVSPPGVGQIIAPQTVPLKPAGFETLYTFIRTVIDIVATIAVFNMLQDKVKAFLVGEQVVTIDGD